MDHSSLIDIIRSERFTLVEIREENKLQLVNTVNVLMNYLSSYPAWIIESGLHDLETSNQLQIILQNTNRVLEPHHQLTAENFSYSDCVRRLARSNFTAPLSVGHHKRLY